MRIDSEILNEYMKAHGLDVSDVDSLIGALDSDWVEYNKTVVGIREFVESPFYMGAQTDDGKSIIYPKVMVELERMNDPSIHEIVLTGGIGTAKTTCALYTQAYQLYILSCMKSPHAVFDLDPASEIVIVFQNLNAQKAKEVDYKRFRAMIERSPYFRKYFPFNKDVLSQIQFPNRIVVKPISGDAAAAIGENVIGGLIDEVNFMEIVEKSKKVKDGSGHYNQAEVLYDAIERRRESRFMKHGHLPGVLCLVSSKQYPGEFTDLRMDAAKHDPGIYVYDKTVWDVKPDDVFSHERFWVYCGDSTTNPYILPDDEEPEDTDDPMFISVPVDYRKNFETDLIGSLREIGGRSFRASYPFFTNAEAVNEMFGRVESILSRHSVDFSVHNLFCRKHLISDLQEPRFVHLDLSLTSDHAGLSCGYVRRFIEVDRGAGLFDVLPEVVMDFTLDIIPPRGGEIDYSRIRKFLYGLAKVGLNVRWVTADSFQSADMMQQLKKNKYLCKIVSMDSTTVPYEIAKGAVYDRRVLCPVHPVLHRELVSLEINKKDGKIDHPPNGSKDVADAFAGVVYGLSMRRELWMRHGVSTADVNRFVQQVKDKLKSNVQMEDGVNV